LRDLLLRSVRSHAAFDLIYNPAFVMMEGGLAQAAAAPIAGIEGGLTYFNIHTVNNPGGEIRGELSTVPGPIVRAGLPRLTALNIVSLCSGSWASRQDT